MTTSCTKKSNYESLYLCSLHSYYTVVCRVSDVIYLKLNSSYTKNFLFDNKHSIIFIIVHENTC